MVRRLLSLLVCLIASLLVCWPRPAWAGEAGERGAGLFGQHCVGCHVNGGNIIRRGKTLKLEALRRNGIVGSEAIAAIAAGGIGQMGGYGGVLGEGGPEAVGAWVWQQAEAGWPRA
jgi:cytochrome c6